MIFLTKWISYNSKTNTVKIIKVIFWLKNSFFFLQTFLKQTSSKELI